MFNLFKRFIHDDDYQNQVIKWTHEKMRYAVEDAQYIYKQGKKERRNKPGKLIPYTISKKQEALFLEMI